MIFQKNAILKIAAFSIFLLSFQHSIFCQTVFEMDKNDIRALEKSIAKFIPKKSFELQNLSNTVGPDKNGMVTGEATFFEQTNIDFSIKLDQGGNIKNLVCDFANPPEINLFKLIKHSKFNEQLESLIPEKLMKDSQIKMNSFDVFFNPVDGDIDSLNLKLKTEMLEFFDFGNFTFTSAEIILGFYENEKGKNAKGRLTGVIPMGQGNMSMTGNLSTNKNEIFFEGKSENSISIEDLLQKAGGQELMDDFLNVMPEPVFQGISIPKFDFSVYPFEKSFQITTDSDLGLQTFKFVQDKKKVLYTYSNELNPNFGLGDISTPLKVIDELNFLDSLKLVLTNNPDDRLLGNGNDIGLELIASLKPNEQLNKLFEGAPGGSDILKKLKFSGFISKNMNASLGVVLDLNIPVGNLEFRGFDFYVELDGKSASAGVASEFLLSGIDNTNLLFDVDFALVPQTASLIGAFNIKSINGDGNSKDWEEPFGIPYLTIAELGGSVGLSAQTLISQIGMDLDVKIGDVDQGTFDKRISGKSHILLATTGTFEIDVTAKNVNILRTIEAFDPEVQIPGEIARFLNTGLESVEIYANDSQGELSLKGDAIFLGELEGSVSVIANKSGKFFASGTLDPIHFPSADVPIFSFTSLESSQTGPGFLIDSEDYALSMDGNLEVLKMPIAGVNADITKQGFEVSGKGRLLGLLPCDFTVFGKDLLNSNSIWVKGNVDSDFINSFRDKLGDFSIIVPRLNDISFYTAISDCTSEINLNVDVVLFEEDHLHLDLKLSIDMSGQSSIDEIIINFLTDALSNFENITVFAFTAAAATAKFLATSAFEAAKYLFEGLTEGLTYIGEAIYKLFAERTFDNAIAGPPLNYIPTGYQPYTISLNSVETEDSDDEIYGRIFFGTGSNDYIIPAGTNNNFMGVDEGSEVKGSKINHLKHLYVDHTKSVEFDFQSEMYLYRPTVVLKDYKFTGSVIKDISKINKKKDFTLVAKHDGDKWRAKFTVMPGQRITSEMLITNLENNDLEGLAENLNKGGDLTRTGDRGLELVIEQKNAELLSLFDTLKVSTNKKHLDLATKGNYNKNLVHQVLRMLDTTKYAPDANHINYILENKDFHIATQMLNMKGKPNNESVSLAIRASQDTLVKIILESGLSARSEHLDLALEKKDTKAFKHLLAFNPNLKKHHLTEVIKNKMFWEFFVQIADQIEKPEENSYLESAKANNTSFFSKLCSKDQSISKVEIGTAAIKNENQDILIMSFNQGVDADKAIKYAVDKGSKEAVMNCIYYGAEPSSGMKYAIEHNELMMVQLFVEDYHIDPTNQSYIVQSVLLTDTDKGSHASIVEYLIAMGADPNEYRDERCNSLLHLVCHRWRKKGRDFEMVKVLIDGGADLTATNEKRWTALHSAANCAGSNYDMVHYILEEAEKIGLTDYVNACAYNRKRVYQIAEGRKVKKYLKSKGAIKKRCPK